MRSRKTRVMVAILAVLVTAGISAAGLRHDGLQAQTGPVFPIEGVWYGMTFLNGLPPIASVDTMTANAQRPGEAGTFLCNVPAIGKVPNPLNPNGWLSATPWGQGTWVRIGTNRAAFTAVRTIVTESGQFFGWAKFWGTMTVVSENEIAGTMNVQYFAANGTPLFPHALSGTVQRSRLEIVFEQQE